MLGLACQMAWAKARESYVQSCRAGALGSPGFVAPEIIMHENHGPAMDVFSLGIVLFIMLVGRKPFNIKECENLTYCNIDIKDAPGLQDAR